MKRSTGITVSAVLVFVGSGFTILAALLVGLSVALLHATNPSHALPKSFGFFGVIFYLVLAAWGISTGIALLRLREWGRISLLVFAALLTMGTLGAALMMLFITLPVPPNNANPVVTQQLMWSVKVGMEVFYCVLGALGVWWLYYFCKKSIRAEFRQPQFLPAPLPAFVVSSVPLAGASVVLPPVTAPARPVSISIIAAMLLLGAAMLPINLLYRTPVLMFGFLLSGWQAFLVGASLFAANLAAGVGLFKLKLWARTLAIAIAIFGLINALATILVPGSQSRWDQAMQAIFDKWGLPSNMPIPHFPVWLFMLPMIPFVFAELYFLITRKPAFLAQAAGAPVPSDSPNF